MRHFARLLLFWLLLAADAHAETRTLSSRIDAVTVHPGQAVVTRIAESELPAGRHTLELSGLPAGIDADSVSLRLREEQDGIRLGAVSVASRPRVDSPSEAVRRLTGEIEDLREEQQLQADRIEVAELEISFIESVGKSIAASAAAETASGGPAPESWRRAWEALGNDAQGALTRITEARRRQRELGALIDKKEREREQLQNSEARETVVTAAIELDQPSPVPLSLSYHVGNASWRPLYELRLDGEAGTLSTERLALVSQRTGEPWRDVALSLSNVPPSGDISLPELRPWFLDVRREPPVPLRNRALTAEMAQLDEAQPVVTSLATSWSVEGRVDLAPDGRERRVLTSRHVQEAEPLRRTVPKLSETVHILAELENLATTPMLPGPALLYRDGSFVGRARLEGLLPGGRREVSFGVDRRITVRRRLETGMREREGIVRRRARSERDWLIELQNGYNRSVKIEVLDQLPVPQDERIVVNLLERADPPGGVDVGEQRGILLWSFSLAAGEQRTIRLAFSVERPEGLALDGFDLGWN